MQPSQVKMLLIIYSNACKLFGGGEEGGGGGGEGGVCSSCFNPTKKFRFKGKTESASGVAAGHTERLKAIRLQNAFTSEYQQRL